MSEPYKCTAKVEIKGGIVRTESCKTRIPLIDDGGSPSGDRDDYVCPDCGKRISIYYNEGD